MLDNSILWRYSMRRLTIAFIAATSIFTSVSASALIAKQSVEKEIVVQMPDGTESITRAPAELVIPGERVVYTLSYTNDDAAPATDLVLTMPVPSEIKYMDESATTAGAKVVYSADGGQTFASRAGLRVVGADGNIRTAISEDITHIRWTVAGPLAVGETGLLSYKGILK